MPYNDNFRALASILINENIDEDLKKKAKGTITKIMDIMEKETELEMSQLVKVSAGMAGIQTQ